MKNAVLCALLCASLVSTPIEASVADGPVVSGEIALKADALLRDLVPFGFSGTAIIARHGKILFAQGYGLADREKALPMTATSVISIGSITKQFTAAAIMKLQAQGKLSSTDRITKFFPAVPADKAGITLHELLTHTAGLRSDFSETDYEPYLRDQYVARILAAPLNARPGTRFEYSNAGYSLLAAIVEIASGKPYERYLRDALFLPAGMTATGYKLARWNTGQVAAGYDGTQRWGTILQRPWASDGPYWELRGNGGIHSTVFDMYRWARALRTTAVLPQRELTEMQTPYVRDDGPGSYAYGWSVEESPFGKLISHNGGNGIFAADFLRFVDRDTVIYIASTNSELPATVLSHRLARLTFGQPYSQPPHEIALAPAVLDSWAGTYASKTAKLGVLRDGHSLRITCQHTAACAVLLPLDPRLAGDAAKRAAQTRSAFEQAAIGNLQELAAAYGDNAPEDLAARQRAFWERQSADLGTLLQIENIAQTHHREDLAMVVRADFERGSRYLTLYWGPRRAQGMTVSADPPGLRFVPVSETQLTGYDAAAGETVHATIDHDAKTLSVSSQSGTFTGTRAP